MPLELRDIAYQITSEAPDAAAATTARLLKAIFDLFPSNYGYKRFLSSLQYEMAKLGFQFYLDPNLDHFHNLKVGENFRTLDGKRYRKIEPVGIIDPRENLTVYLEALDLDEHRPVYFRGAEVVQKTDAS